MSMLRTLADWRVVAVLVAFGVGVALFAPSVISATIPLVIVAACPLSMVLMMRSMGGHQTGHEPAPFDASADPVGQLRERLAATRLERHRIEQELARLDSADGGATAAAPTRGSAADARARSS